MQIKYTVDQVKIHVVALDNDDFTS
jgi:hypothetical protein